MPLRFTFRQLEYFVAVGEAGTIALAAQRINVSSPSISVAISQLEAELGIQIFIRHHAQGLSLTPGGRRLYNEVKKILDSAIALNGIANDIKSIVRGHISIGVMTTVAPLLSASIHRSFVTQFPDVSVTLREGNQVELLHMLGRAEIDVAITYDLELPKNVTFDPLASLPPYAMVSKDSAFAKHNKISLNALEHEPMILLDLPLSREYFLSCFHLAGIQPNIIERTPQLSVVRSLVANNFGFSLINIKTQNNLAPDGKKLVFIPLTHGIRPMILGVVTKQVEHRSMLLKEFVKHIDARIKAKKIMGIS